MEVEFTRILYIQIWWVCVGVCLTQERWYLSAKWRTVLTAFPPAPALKPHNSVWLWCSSPIPEPLSPPEPKVSTCEGEFEHCPFKKVIGFPAAFSLTRSKRGIPADSHNQMLWRLLFLALMFQAREPRVGLRPRSSGGTSAGEMSP